MEGVIEDILDFLDDQSLQFTVDATTSIPKPSKRASNLWGSWYVNPVLREEIANEMAYGKLVRIPNVLRPEVAEQFHSEIWSHETWREDVLTVNQIQLKRHVANPKLTNKFVEGLFCDTKIWEALCGVTIRSLDIKCTWFQEGGFITPHTDATRNRGMSFVLNLTKNWKPAYGGCFWWFQGNSVQLNPEFNSLYLFIPTSCSRHMVSPVIQPKLARRLTLSGFFVSNREEVRDRELRTNPNKGEFLLHNLETP